MKRNGVSIIMPIYNSEKYLKRSIESVCCQTNKDWELILIDNNSIDSSLEICEQMAKLDNRIIIKICKENGVSAARNLGIEMASFDKIMFIDSDDIYDYECVEKMSQCNDDEWNICFFDRFTNEKEINKSCKIKDYDFEKFDDIIAFLHKNDLFNTVWNKIYSKKILEENKLRFDCNLSIAEDLKFNLEYLRYVKKINVLGEKLYYYRINKDGMNLKIHLNRIDIRKELYYYEKNFFKEKDYKLNSVYREYIKICLAELKQINKTKNTHREKVCSINEILQNELRTKELKEIFENTSVISKFFTLCLKNRVILHIFAQLINIMKV